jgi:hypothetical protein
MSQQHPVTFLPVSHRGSSDETDAHALDATLNKTTKATWALRIVVFLWSVVSIGLILIAVALAVQRAAFVNLPE